MSVIHYPRHFALIAAAAVVAALLPRIAVRVHVDPFMLQFAVDGLLYAATVILALAAPARWYVLLAFAGISVLLGAASPYAGLALASLLRIHGAAALPAAFALAAAAGAAAYFVVVRACFIRTLMLRTLWHSVALCVGATLLAYLIAVVTTPSPLGAYLAPLLDALPAVGWWLGFSLSLYLAERVVPAGRSPSHGMTGA